MEPNMINHKSKIKSRKPAEYQHKQYAKFIKQCHLNLRLSSQEIGADEAWKKHCSDELLLKNYSSTMHQLASQFWDANNKQEITSCRISWIAQNALKYFEDDFLHENEREELLAKRFKVNIVDDLCTKPDNPYYLLDVGSCYNPFKSYSFFKVLPIDIAPAFESVVKCDFLSVNIGAELSVTKNVCYTLPFSSFDVVVFSFLLEYFPTPWQRYTCCEKAYSILKPAGLLIIATPDSSHATHNSKLMKNWKFALANLGFWRIKYEKLTHMHCMIFKKCKSKQIPLNWLHSMNLKNSSFESYITIPQDYRIYLDIDDKPNNSESTNCEDIANLFSELVDNITE
ncbi:S-adenosylmethionine sensor upstream of mTORC1 [Adelges cooleyi]|uniref:S-adenosylmethionine sensor upstream of mTORC1 n=1 Tax=Adelges cooleyi TaxID=133065 RepID=UPI0021806207|nr:S-adenosylmethionine sensor upstream of mTORC1 [Adelges cooleyi]